MNTETQYVTANHGIQSSTPMHHITKDGCILRCTTRELPAMLADGWTRTGETSPASAAEPTTINS